MRSCRTIVPGGHYSPAVANGSMVSVPWDVKAGTVIPRRLETSVVKVARELIVKLTEVYPTEQKARVLCLLDASGVGKTYTIIDAARLERLLHIHVVLGLCDYIREAATQVNQLFNSGNSNFQFRTENGETRGYILRQALLDAYADLYKDSIARLFVQCRVALMLHLARQSAVNEAPHIVSCKVNSSEVHDAIPSVTDAAKDIAGAWSALSRLIRSIPGDYKFVFHIDECQDIFPSRKSSPRDGDIQPGSPKHAFTVEEAPQLALKAFILALKPYIMMTQERAVWAFTGLRPNLRPCFNVPTSVTYCDLSAYLTYFTPEEVYTVFCNCVHGPRDEKTGRVLEFSECDPKLQLCMKRLAGPPRMIQCLINALQAENVQNVSEMVAKWGTIEDLIVAQMRARFVPGLLSSNARTLNFCCLAPYLERLGLLPLQLDSAKNFWSDLVERGLTRLVPYDGDSPRREYFFELPYFLLEKAMCQVSGCPIFIVRTLASIEQCGLDSLSKMGKTFEVVFIASLVSPKSPRLYKWATDELHLSPLSPPSLSPLSSTSPLRPTPSPLGSVLSPSSDLRTAYFGTNFAIDGSMVDISYDPSRKDSGADITFEGLLNMASSVSVPGHDSLQEKVCVALQLSLSKKLSVDQRRRCIIRLVENATRLFEESKAGQPGHPGKRTIIVLGAPCLDESDREDLNQLFKDACRDVDSRYPSGPYADLDIGAPLTKFCASVNVVAHTPMLPVHSPMIPVLPVLPLRPFAVFCVLGSSPIWKDMCIPVDAIKSNDVEAMAESLVRHFLPGCRYNPRSIMDVTDLELDQTSGGVPSRPLKRKATDMADVYQSLKDAMVVSREQISLFEKLTAGWCDVGSLRRLTQRWLVDHGMASGPAEFIADHLASTYDLIRPRGLTS